MLEKMKYKGSALEKEKAEAMEKAQAAAEQAQESRKAKEYAEMDAETTARHMELMAETAKEEAEFVSQQLQSKTERLAQERKSIKEEQQLLEEYETSLKEAQATVERLRDVLRAKGGNEELLEKTNRLQIFFDSSMDYVGEDHKHLKRRTMMSVAGKLPESDNESEPPMFDASLFEDVEEEDSESIVEKIRRSLGSQGRRFSGSMRRSFGGRGSSKQRFGAPPSIPAMPPPTLPPRRNTLCDDDV
jgi:hypothetical protein